MLYLLFAHIFKICLNSVSDLFINATGNTDAAGFGNTFKTSGYVYALTVDIHSVVNDIA